MKKIICEKGSCRNQWYNDLVDSIGKEIGVCRKHSKIMIERMTRKFPNSAPISPSELLKRLTLTP